MLFTVTEGREFQKKKRKELDIARGEKFQVRLKKVRFGVLIKIFDELSEAFWWSDSSGRRIAIV